MWEWGIVLEVVRAGVWGVGFVVVVRFGGARGVMGHSSLTVLDCFAIICLLPAVDHGNLLGPGRSLPFFFERGRAMLEDGDGR